MKRFFSHLTRNWGLKLLAFVLALIIFYAVRDSIRVRGHHSIQNFMKGSSDAEPARR